MPTVRQLHRPVASFRKVYRCVFLKLACLVFHQFWEFSLVTVFRSSTSLMSEFHCGCHICSILLLIQLLKSVSQHVLKQTIHLYSVLIAYNFCILVEVLVTRHHINGVWIFKIVTSTLPFSYTSASTWIYICKCNQYPEIEDWMRSSEQVDIVYYCKQY